ncbi:MAG TPA: hypothetical protein VLX29_05695 [Nitrospirota bacterium]|nr:hypothetical protein [Nitrospirota bacterium]
MAAKSVRKACLPSSERFSTMGEQRITLTFHETTIFASKSGVFVLSNLVQGLIKMPEDMELIVQDGCLGSFLAYGFFKRLPHVYDRKSYFTGLFWP